MPNKDDCDDTDPNLTTFCPDCDDKCQDCYKNTGQPISLLTGSMHHKFRLFSLPKLGLPMEFNLYYESGRNEKKTMGYGWSHSYSAWLNPVSSERVVITEEGSLARTVFDTVDGGLTWKVGKQKFSSLSKDATGYTWTKNDGKTYRFDLTGKLLSVTATNGTSVILTHGTYGPVTITDNFGRTITLAYNGYGQVSSVTDPNGNVYSMTYSSNNLASVKYPDGDSDPNNNPTDRFYYVDYPKLGLTNGGDIHNLTKYVNANGVARYMWSYNTSDRAILSKGHDNNEYVSISYDSAQTVSVTNSKS